MAEKDYTSYDASELAQDPGFIRWVKGTDEAAARYWEQWQADHPERATEVEQARRLVYSVRFREAAPDPERVDRLWARISESIDQPVTAPGPAPEARVVRMKRLRWMGIAAAACAVLLVIFQVWSNRSVETVETGAGEMITYQLPDGSTVRLNAGSTLQLQPKRWARERRLQLSGEAFFEVKKGTPFTVETESGSVAVLGTSFNVLSREGRFKVDCFTGRVRVRLNEAADGPVLTPGRGARLDTEAGELRVYDFARERTASWREGTIYYESEPLSEVFWRLERQFGVTVESAPEIEQRIATGFFKLNNLDSALFDVTWPVNLEYRIEGRKVRIFEREEQ